MLHIEKMKRKNNFKSSLEEAKCKFIRSLDYLEIIGENYHPEKQSTLIEVNQDLYEERVKKEYPALAKFLVKVATTPNNDQRLAVCYKNFKKHNGKYYVLGKHLPKCLAKVSVDISPNLLKDFVGYLEIPNLTNAQGDKILFAFVSIVTIGEYRHLIIATSDENLHTDSIRGVLKPDVSIAEFLSKFKIVDEDGKVDIGNDTGIIKDVRNYENKEKPSVLRTILNAVLFIQQPDADMVLHRNKFDKKRSKMITQKKIYSSLPIHFVGPNFGRLVLEGTKQYGVSGHFRWQPCGPERSQIKLTFVKPHTRSKSKVIAELTNPLPGLAPNNHPITHINLPPTR